MKFSIYYNDFLLFPFISNRLMLYLQTKIAKDCRVRKNSGRDTDFSTRQSRRREILEISDHKTFSYIYSCASHCSECCSCTNDRQPIEEGFSIVEWIDIFIMRTTIIQIVSSTAYSIGCCGYCWITTFFIFTGLTCYRKNCCSSKG